MSAPRKLDAKLLKGRLKSRKRKHGTRWFLDLRHEDFGHLGRVTVRDPEHPEWPTKGRAASTRAEAERWVGGPYLDWVRNEVARRRSGSRAVSTVAQACDRYLADLTAELGADHNTVANRRSVFNAHVKPAFGSLPLAALTTDRVAQFLRNLTVTKRRHGEVRQEEASYRTKTNVRTALQALWRHFHEDTPPPFGTIRLKDNTRARRRRLAAQHGVMLLDLDRDAYSPEEVRRILAHAIAYDREILGRPNLAATTIPNTAETIALQLGFATRIHELVAIRWRYLFEDEGVIWIPGTKTDAAPRWFPLLDSVRPWIARLRDKVPGPAPEDYLLRKDPRPGQGATPPSKKTYQGRIARVLRRADLKFDRKLTHIFRATHVTWAIGAGLPKKRIEVLIGHAKSEDEAFNRYVDAALVARLMTERDRTYLPWLPTPEECEELAREIEAKRR
jgi:integrase